MWRTTQTFSKISGVPRGTVPVSGGRCRTCTSQPQQQQPKKPAEKATKQQAPPPPPPPPKSGGGWFWKLLGVTVIGAGGTVGYAWYDDKFKKTLESNVPYSKEALEYIFKALPASFPGESKPNVPKIPSGGPIVVNKDELEAVRKQGLARVISPADPLPEVKPVPPKTEPKPTQNYANIKPSAADEKKRIAEEKKAAAAEKKRLEQEQVKRALQDKEAEEAAENAALETILGAMVDEAVDTVRKAVEEQQMAARATRTHSQQLKKAMDDESSEADKTSQWESVAVAFEDKANSILNASHSALDAEEKIEQLKLAIKDGKDNKITKKNKAIMEAEEKLNKVQYDLKTAKADYTKSESEAKVMKEYRDLVKKGKEQFKKELESIMPDVKIGRKWAHFTGKMTEEELNSLIAHAHKRIEQLNKQLAEQQALEEQRMQIAIENKQKEDEKIADELVVREQDKLKAEFEVQKQRMEVDAGVRFEQDLRQQLARQAAAHSDHLAEVLKIQERELYQKYNNLLEEQVMLERDRLRGDLKGHISRLRGIEAAIEGRAEMEKQGRKAQELWLACQTLYNIILTGKEGEDVGERQMKPLGSELTAIKEAGNEHPFVNTVIASFPEEASQRGVWTSEALFDRFGKVRRVCKRVAMIDERGGSLFRYFLSYLQSFLVFSKGRPLTDNDEIEPVKLTTFVILDQAAFCMERGDLEQALRFMNQLQGESRRVAEDWINEVRLLLEARQAADALLAHASASGLGSLF